MRYPLYILLVAAFITAPIVKAATETIDGVKWTYTVSSGKAIVGNGTDPAIPTTTIGTLQVPDRLGNLPVTAIGDSAFDGCCNLTSVVIPSGVTLIGQCAFWQCTKLISVAIPEGLQSICDGAFEGCSKLKSVIIPSSVTSIGQAAFLRCGALTNVTIRNGVKSIGIGAFEYCSTLPSITIPQSITSIGREAFHGCSALKTIYVSSGDTKRISKFYSFETSVSFIEYGKPTNVMATKGSHTECVCVSWLTVNGAISYDIYRSTTANCPTSPLAINVSNPYQDITAEAGTRYYYWVDAVTPAGSSVSWCDEDSCGYCAVTLKLDAVSNLYPASGSTGVVNVAANTSWVVETDVDWITLETKSGGTNGAVNFVVSANTLAIGREGTITVKAGLDHSEIKSIQVTQEKASAFQIVDGVLTRYIGIDEDVIIPNNVTRIGDSAFLGCAGLVSVTIPECVTNIGDSAFSGCTSLTSVAIAKGLTRIGFRAFAGCSSLSCLSIPSSVAKICSGAFSGCTGLGTGIVSRGLYVLCVNGDCPKHVSWNDGIVLIADGAFEGSAQVVSVTIPFSTRYIGERAFANCRQLQSVTIENSGGVVNCVIGDNAFSGCAELSRLNIPSSVTRIGKCVFSGCENLKAVSVVEGDEDRVKVLLGTENSRLCCTNIWRSYVNGIEWTYTVENNEATLGGGSSETPAISTNISDTITLPRSLGNFVVRSVGDYAFMNQRNCFFSYSQPSVIPKCIRRIGDYAFCNCSGLYNLTYDSESMSGVTNIGKFAFYGCRGLSAITLAKSVLTIGEGAFSGCKKRYGYAGENGLYSINVDPESQNFTCIDGVLYDKAAETLVCCPAERKTLSIPLSVVAIAPSAFSGCSGLSEVDIPERVASIGAEAFRNCYSLINLSIPPGVQEIYSSTLYDCHNLRTVTLPPTIRSIGDCAFYNCSNLVAITIPAAVEEIGSQAFERCSRLKTIDVPVGVQRISNRAFFGCSDLETLILPVGLSIGVNAFYGCKIRNLTEPGRGYYSCGLTTSSAGLSITNLAISRGATVVNNSAYNGCSSLRAVTIPSGVKVIDAYAFHQCTRLTTLYIPASVRELKTHSFSDCYCLTNIVFGGDAPTICEDRAIDSYVRIEVDGKWRQPQSTITVYEGSTGWDKDGDGLWHGRKIIYLPTKDIFPQLNSDSDVRVLLTAAVDEKLIINITNVSDYSAFREWAAMVKAANGNEVAGPLAVLNDSNAWLSYAIASDTLIGKTLTNGQMRVDAFMPTSTAGSFDFTVSIDDIAVGSDATKENLKKVFGLEGGASLDELSADNVDITFSTPVDGKVKFTAGPNAKNVDAKTFFMKVKLNP